jgi:hypothetical protein
MAELWIPDDTRSFIAVHEEMSGSIGGHCGHPRHYGYEPPSDQLIEFARSLAVGLSNLPKRGYCKCVAESQEPHPVGDKVYCFACDRQVAT